MLDSFGPRQIAPSGPAASLPAMQAGEKVVHRPEKKVLPVEKADRAAQTGPRPSFELTYLQQLAAIWPEEPDPPVTNVDHDSAGGDAAPSGAAEARPAQPGTNPAAVALPADTPEPTIDIRR